MGDISAKVGLPSMRNAVFVPNMIYQAGVGLDDLQFRRFSFILPSVLIDVFCLLEECSK